MAHAQKPDFVFPRNGRAHLNRWGRQFSWLLAAEVCTSALVMLDTPCLVVAWEYWLPTPFASFPLHFPSRASPCAIRFRTSSTTFNTHNHTLTGKTKQSKFQKPIKVHKTANVAVQYVSLFFAFHKHWVQICFFSVSPLKCRHITSKTLPTLPSRSHYLTLCSPSYWHL